MKNISMLILTTSFLISKTSFQDNIKDLVTQIQTPRNGVNSYNASIIENPFFTGDDMDNEQINSTNCNVLRLNTASKKDFMRIEGIDRFYASKIIRYREEFGLEDISELNNIKGMGPIRIKAIENYIKDSKCKAVNNKIYITKDVKKKRKRVTRKNLILQIIVNKRAKISNYWYGIGDKIRGYKIKEIGLNFVKIEDRFTKKILRFSKKYKNRYIDISIR